MKRQVHTHHYCSHLNEDVQQCVLYDGPDPNAKLIGVEYIISYKLYQQLPVTERKLWHTHAYEVKSGLLAAPNVPTVVENQFMNQFANTYGKSFHFWHVDKGDQLPLGIPQVMMSFTEDDQIKPELIKQRDAELRTSTNELKKSRITILPPIIDRNADCWKKGKKVQLKLQEE